MQSDRMVAASRSGALRALARLVAAYLAFGLAGLAGDALRWLAVSVTEPGDGTGPLTAVVRLFRHDGGGETWVGLFVLASSVTVALIAVLLTWAVRRGERVDPPGLLLALGIGGLAARLVSFWVNIALVSDIAESRGVESLAAYSIAVNVEGTVEAALSWLLGAAALVLLVLAVMRDRATAHPQGPYRQPD